jgi:hypothetical protein
VSSSDRLVFIEIDPGILVEMMSGHDNLAVTSDMPGDAEIVRVIWDDTMRRVRVLVHSETFAEVVPGAIIPNWNPTLHTIYPDPDYGP